MHKKIRFSDIVKAINNDFVIDIESLYSCHDLVDELDTRGITPCDFDGNGPHEPGFGSARYDVLTAFEAECMLIRFHVEQLEAALAFAQEKIQLGRLPSINGNAPIMHQ